MEACAQYAFLAEFRNPRACKAAFEATIELLLREKPVQFTKLPSIFRQLLTIDTEHASGQDATLKRIEALLADPLTRRQTCEAYSEAEAQSLVACSWNAGVALFRTKQLGASLCWMQRALALMNALLPNKFEKKRAEMEGSRDAVLASVAQVSNGG